MNVGGFGHRAPLLWLLLPFMAGLTAGRLLDLPAPPLLGAATIALLIALVLSFRSSAGARGTWPLALGGAVALAAAAYFHLRLNRPPEWNDLPPREARLTLEVTQVFTSAHGRNRVNGLAVVADAAAHLRGLIRQRLYFSLTLPPGTDPPLRSAAVAAVGVIELLPRQPVTGGFDAYLADAGVNFRFSRGRMLGEVAPPSRYQRFCHLAAQQFERILSAGLSDQPALAAIYRAMMMGQKQAMSEEQRTLFLHSGTMHLFAISGLNITAIALSMQILLSLLRVPRLAAAAAGLATLWLYVDITGTSSSAVRAFIMCALLMVSFSLRRPANPLATLTASALLILLVEPMQLFGASFQMSYGIVAVLLLLGGPLAKALQTRWPLFIALPESTWRWYHRWSDGLWRGLLGALGIGLASSLVSTISSIQFFGLFTPGSLVVNLVLIPISTFVIGAGFISLLCGLIGFTAGSMLFNHAGILLIWFMDRLLRMALAVPGVFHAAQFRAAWMGPAILATLLAICLFGYAWHWRRERGGFWTPFALTACLIALGVRLGE
jgi:competence protein ComEC